MGTSPSTGAGSRAEDSPARPKRFPQWTRLEQEFWQDMFETYSETLLQQDPMLDSELSNRNPYQLADEQQIEYLVQKVQIAARLADEATIEMIYRFERQQPVKRQRQRMGGDGGDDRHKKRKRRPVW